MKPDLAATQAEAEGRSTEGRSPAGSKQIMLQIDTDEHGLQQNGGRQTRMLREVADLEWSVAPSQAECDNELILTTGKVRDKAQDAFIYVKQIEG